MKKILLQAIHFWSFDEAGGRRLDKRRLHGDGA